MKFDKLLEYQNVDKEMLALEEELAKSVEYKNLCMTKKRLDDAAGMVKRLQAEAGDVVNQYERIEQKASNIVVKIKEIESNINHAADVNEVDHYTKLLNNLIEELSSLETEVNKDVSKSGSIENDFKNKWQEGQQLAVDFKKAKTAFEVLRNSKESQLKEITTKLKALIPEIDPELFQIYQSLRKNRKLPPVVKYNIDTKTCSGCRMDISNDIQCRLKKTGDYVECPNCRRILFFEE